MKTMLRGSLWSGVAKSEGRNPELERRPKSEARKQRTAGCQGGSQIQSAVALQPERLVEVQPKIRPQHIREATARVRISHVERKERKELGLLRSSLSGLWPFTVSSAIASRISDFGLLSGFGIRVSGFGHRALAYERRRTATYPWLCIFCFTLAAGVLAQEPAFEEGRSRFGAVDIYVDSGSAPLAAYQLELAATNGVARIVGIEGGEHPAFRQPPYYDPKAIQHERVIIASFNTGAAADLPRGKTRVATIHYETREMQPLRFEVKVHTAGDVQGHRISVQASYKERKTP